MNALATRTIRRLDERSEVKVVAGFVIETGIPLPDVRVGKGTILAALLALEVGESLVHRKDAKDARSTARKRRPGTAYSCRPIAGGKFRIWRSA